jgi:hypothetical protein
LNQQLDWKYLQEPWSRPKLWANPVDLGLRGGAQVNDSGLRAAARYGGELSFWVYNWQTDAMTLRKYEVSAEERFYKQARAPSRSAGGGRPDRNQPGYQASRF